MEKLLLFRSQEFSVNKANGVKQMTLEQMMKQQKIVAVFFTVLASLTSIAAAITPAIV